MDTRRHKKLGSGTERRRRGHYTALRLGRCRGQCTVVMLRRCSTHHNEMACGLDMLGYTAVLSGSPRASRAVPARADGHRTDGPPAGLDMDASCHCVMPCGTYRSLEALGRGTRDTNHSLQGTPRPAGNGDRRDLEGCSSRAQSWKPRPDRNSVGDDWLHWVAYMVSDDVVAEAAKSISCAYSLASNKMKRGKGKGAVTGTSDHLENVCCY